MNQSSRAIQLSVFLVIILLGMTLSSALNSGDSNELKKEETAQQTHANVSTLFYPGSQGGSTYSYSTISASEDSTCAVAEDHSMRCWGRNNHLQLGTESTPTNTSLNEPKKVYLDSGGGSSSALEVSGYGEHTCALMSDGRMSAGAVTTWRNMVPIRPHSYLKPHGSIRQGPWVPTPSFRSLQGAIIHAQSSQINHCGAGATTIGDNSEGDSSAILPFGTPQR